jgi:hypothetical protein
MPRNMAAENSEPPDPQNRDWGSQGDLPDPDLNPMMNPILGRNLGKWAHVYFTSPPEKRAEAVAGLLRELEGTAAGRGGTAERAADNNLSPDQSEPNERWLSTRTQEAVGHPPEVARSLACPECAHINAPEHWFCGFCGTPLKGTALKRGQNQVAAPTEPSGNRTRTRAQPAGDVEWLRAKTLPRFDAGRRPVRKLLLTTLAIATIALSYVALSSYQWRNRAPAAASSVRPAHPAPALPSASKSQSAASSAESSEIQTDSSRPSGLANKSAEYKTGTATLATIASNSPVAPGSSSQATQLPVASSPDAGDRELAIAEAFLRGQKHGRDATEAAKWLWRSVSKHNPAALILLADLYKRGDGVVKSCDQAEILLVAAAKKGSVEAGHQLESLQSSGCK